LAATNETEKLLSPKRRSRGAERQKKEGGVSAKDVAMFGAEMLPGVSQAIGVKRTSDALEEKDYVGAGIEGTALAASLFPGFGPAAAKGLRTFNKTRKAYKLFVKGEDDKLYPLFVDANKEIKQGEFLEANFPDVAFKGKRKAGSQESFYVPTKGAKRTPTKYYLDNKEITKKEYNELGPNAKPFSKVIPGEKSKGTGDSIIIPDEETRKKLIDEGFITNRTKRTDEAPFGRVTAVAARPGFHASQAPVATHLGPQDLKITKKEADKLIEAGVTPEAIKRRGKQFYVKRRAEDQVFAEVEMADDIDYQSMLAKEGRSDINDYVPKGGSYRYSDGQADSDQWVVGGDMKVNRVLSREETRAIQKEMGVTDLPYRDEVESILGKKFAKGGMVMDDYLVAKTIDQTQDFAKGGMSKQMELFEPVEGAFDEGGLMQEGGTVDPESGNEVPVGSTQEEVRDDIPAQLSEGEFVFPADVVRYIGLEKLMQMRQEAKRGLKMMDKMGQMGNADEATVPDDIPFDLSDLDMEDDGIEEFAQGGVVEAQQGTFIPPTGVNFTPGGQRQSQYTAPDFTIPVMPPTQPTQPTQPMPPMQPPIQGPEQSPVPTFPQYEVPGIGDFLGGAGGQGGGASQVITIVNTETGAERQINFIPGVTQIPEGFVRKEDYTPTEKPVPDTPKAIPTVQQQEDNESVSPMASTTDATGIAYDRGKIKNKDLKTALTAAGMANLKDVGPAIAALFTGSATGLLTQVGKKAGQAMGYLAGNKQHAGAVLGGVLDNFRAEGEFSIGKTALDQLSDLQQQQIADTFKSVTEQMSGLYTKEVTDKDGNVEVKTKSQSEIMDSLRSEASRLDIPTTFTDRRGNTRNKSQVSLERDISTQLAINIGKEKRAEKARQEAAAAAAKAERERQQAALERAFRNVSDSDDSGPDPSDMSGGEDTGDVGGGPSGPTGSQQEVDDFESDLG
tara:strand:+ start:592 stop:3462 length:2871 start_codon:yes stop_codon:yes gene_type:complete